MSKILLLLAALGVLAGPPLRAADAPPPGQRFVYKEVDGKPLHVEVYLPPNRDPARAKAPGVILFHGGGWTVGSLDQFRDACRYFASRGMVAATADYRTVPKEKQLKPPLERSFKRVCITDAKSAIRWFKKRAGEFGMDPARVVTGGGSAGGHVCVIASLNPGLDDPSDPKDVDASVVAYLLFNPAFCGLGDKDDPEVDGPQQASAKFPPAIVFFGTGDGWWKTGWVPMKRALDAAGATARIDLWTAEGQPHGYWDKKEWNDLNLIEADRFLASLGLLEGPPTLTPPQDGKVLVKQE
jgi:dienelactone hydrolase